VRRVTVPPTKMCSCLEVMRRCDGHVLGLGRAKPKYHTSAWKVAGGGGPLKILKLHAVPRSGCRLFVVADATER